MSADLLEQVAKWLAGAKTAVAFTGAGISTESGIPDFRSPGGVWATNRQIYYDEFLESESARYEYWRQKAIAHGDFTTSSPNAGHLTLAKWQAAGFLRTVVTQNIDGLHQDAGSQDVIEIHGTARFIRCLDCDSRYDAGPLVEQFQADDAVPPCPDCENGRLKHDTISFGQSLNPEVLDRAVQLSGGADVFVALGSSLVVEPAASLPRLAKQNGARLVIINRDPTPLDAIADAIFNDGIGTVVTQIDQMIKNDES